MIGDIPEEPLCDAARWILEHALRESVSAVVQAIKEHVRDCHVCNPRIPELHLIQVKVAQLTASEFVGKGKVA